MTDKEKIQKVFDNLHASPNVLTEVLNMKTNEKIVPIKKKRFLSKAAVAVAAFILIFGSGSVAYALDFGGIQRIVQVWIHGDQTNAIFTVENGSYTLDYKDADGKNVHRGGGGIAYENGVERSLTDEELLEELSLPDVEYKEDGTVWIYYLDQKMEITDKFENDICYVKLEADGKTQYITVKYHDGFTTSPHGYIQPSELG